MSNGDHAATFLYIVGALVLVGSALAARRLPIGQTARMAVAWIVIFAIAFGAFALRADFGALGRRLLAEGTGEPTVEGGAVRIRQDSDGHYWVNARVNNETVRFLVDSGATVTAIGKDTAERVGIEAAGGFPVAVNTANGTIFVSRGVASRLAVGPIERQDFPVWIALNDDEVNVLGMNFLSSLSGWGTEEGWLVLKP